MVPTSSALMQHSSQQPKVMLPLSCRTRSQEQSANSCHDAAGSQFLPRGHCCTLHPDAADVQGSHAGCACQACLCLLADLDMNGCTCAAELSRLEAVFTWKALLSTVILSTRMLIDVLQDQVAKKVVLTRKALLDAVDNIRGAVMMAFPQGLPEWDFVRQAIEGQEDLSGTSVSAFTLYQRCTAISSTARQL